MAKTSKSNTTSTSSSSSSNKCDSKAKRSNKIDGNAIGKVKRTRKSVPRDCPPQRSSIYRGVTRYFFFLSTINFFVFFFNGGLVDFRVIIYRHRWTGRYEAHLWDKNCWNETQNKKGRQGS